MKKFFLSLGVGLFAFLGVLFGVSSSTSNLNSFKEVQKSAVSPSTNVIDFYFDENVNNYELSNQFLLLNLNENSIFSYYDLSNNLIRTDVLSLYSNLDIIIQHLEFAVNNSYSDSICNELLFTGTNNTISTIIAKYNIDYIDNSVYVDTFKANKWYYLNVDSNTMMIIPIEIKGFRIENFTYVEELDSINQLLDPYIGTLTSLNGNTNPDEPIPPSSPSNDPLNDISSTINGVIDWFVDLFNGLSDIFVITDSTGEFVGFSLWGNVLFIQVSLGLVIIVLRWVISLIKGV